MALGCECDGEVGCSATDCTAKPAPRTLRERALAAAADADHARKLAHEAQLAANDCRDRETLQRMLKQVLGLDIEVDAPSVLVDDVLFNVRRPHYPMFREELTANLPCPVPTCYEGWVTRWIRVLADLGSFLQEQEAGNLDACDECAGLVPRPAPTRQPTTAERLANLIADIAVEAMQGMG